MMYIPIRIRVTLSNISQINNIKLLPCLSYLPFDLYKDAKNILTLTLKWIYGLMLIAHVRLTLNFLSAAKGN